MSAGAATLIVGLAGLLLPLVGGAASWLTAKITNKKWVQDIVSNAAATAVQQVETEIVAPMKADLNINTPGGHLTALQGVQVEAAAVKLGQTLAMQVGTAAAPHLFAAAVSAALAKTKPATGADLPSGVKAGLPD